MRSHAWSYRESDGYQNGKQNQYLYTLVVNSNFRALLLRVYYDELMKTGLIY
jgi:hypothetical protein